MKPQTLLALLVGLASASSLHAKWQRLPNVSDKPVEVGAQGMITQGSVSSSTGFGKPESLLSADPTDPVSVATGNSQAVISLAEPSMINRSSFISDGIEGRATLSGSADNKGWAALDEKVFTTSDREVNFAFAGMQVKFIKLEFALSKGGTIRHFQLFGGARDKDHLVQQRASDDKKGYPVNFAGVGGSRVIYASPSPQNGVDEATAYNKFEFPESDDRYRTLIYDLGQLRFMDSFSSVHSPRPVRFEVFTFDKLPEKEDWRGRLAFNPEDFSVREPIAAAEDTRGLGYIKAKPSKLAAARYVAMRWEPDFNPPSFTFYGGSLRGQTFVSEAAARAALAAIGITGSRANVLIAMYLSEGPDNTNGNSNGNNNGNANGNNNGGSNGNSNGIQPVPGSLTGNGVINGNANGNNTTP